MARTLDFALAVLNGAVGDYLVRTNNGLATEMSFVERGQPVRLERAHLETVYAGATSRLAVLVHGLMCTETSWQFADGTDYGQLLARDRGYTPVYVRYNTGRSIPDNGATLALELQALIAAFPRPVEELLFIGFSMGGLVIRSACHVASLENASWLGLVRRAIYVGTPHLGAPLERVGRVVSKILKSIDDPYTRLISDIANLRSEGLQDLGDADLRHEDRARRKTRLSLRDPRHPVPLLTSIQHYLIAGTLLGNPALGPLFGDAVVPLASAINGVSWDPAALPPDHVRVVSGAHVALSHSPAVYQHILSFIEESSCPSNAGAV